MADRFVNFHASFQKDVDGESRCVKGFASLNNNDRSDDLMPPEAFDLARYMNNPQLLVNHTFWKDVAGNKYPAGEVTFASVATAKSLDENTWAVLNESGEQIDTCSKSRFVDLSEGSRGVWVRGNVTRDEVWKMVDDGELNAFSWRGKAAMGVLEVGGIEKAVPVAIDLWETSLVSLPDNYAAMFEIAKSVARGSDIVIVDKDVQSPELAVQRVEFTKTLFTREQAIEWLDARGLSSVEIVDTGDALVAVQKDVSTMRSVKTLSIEFATGAQMYVGFAKTADTGEQIALDKLKDAISGSKLCAVGAPELEEAKEKQSMAKKQQNTETADIAEDVQKSAAEETSESATETSDQELEKGAVSDELEAINKNKWERLAPVFKALSAFDEVVWQADNAPDDLRAIVKELTEILGSEAEKIKSLPEDWTEQVKSAVVDAVSGIQEQVQSINELVKGLQTPAVEKAEDAAEEETATDVVEEMTTEVEKSVEDVEETDADLRKKLEELTNAVGAMGTKIQSISKSVPSERERSEGSTAAKKDPNDVFGKNWPFGE